MELKPEIVELTTRGTTAALLIEAQKHFIGQCIEQILAKIEHLVTNDRLTSESALGLAHEIAAFRRILSRHAQEIARGRAAEARFAQENVKHG